MLVVVRHGDKVAQSGMGCKGKIKKNGKNGGRVSTFYKWRRQGRLGLGGLGRSPAGFRGPPLFSFSTQMTQIGRIPTDNTLKNL